MDKYAPLKIENQLCFPLYAAAREIVKLYTPELAELGITYTQYITMMVLWDNDGVSVKELGAKLYLDSGTLTPVLKSLEKKGYVERGRSPNDERVLVVKVTDEGYALRERALAVPPAVACGVNLEPNESAALYSLLYKLLDNFGCKRN